LSASASVTLNFQDGSGTAGGLANSAGTLTNGMNYAIVVDTTGNGFNPGLYESFDINSSGIALTIAGSATDDYFVFGSALGTTATGGPPTFGVGSMVSALSNITYGAYGQSDPFAIIWFESNSANEGDSYGFHTDAGLVLPSDGSSVSFVSEIGTNTKTASFTVVPEPAHYAALVGLLGLGMVLLRRRR
jgi:hypothetical protein